MPLYPHKEHATHATVPPRRSGGHWTRIGGTTYREEVGGGGWSEGWASPQHTAPGHTAGSPCMLRARPPPPLPPSSRSRRSCGRPWRRRAHAQFEVVRGQCRLAHWQCDHLSFIACANGDPNLIRLVFSLRNEMARRPAFPGSLANRVGLITGLQMAAVTPRLLRSSSRNCVAVLSHVFLRVFRVA